MNAGILLLPLILIRYVLLYLLSKDAFRRAAHFPPFAGKEKVAYYVYQASSILMFAYLLFLRVTGESPWLAVGLPVFAAGAVLCAVSVIHFAKPDGKGLNRNGLYRVSRNPMYVSYFLYFMGCVLLTKSPVLLILLLAFQISSHWLILSEERWCFREFGDEYARYMSQVRRYL
jgi:protein-S-isoprenylcysteine O-methyltransferase Ste14